MAATYEEALRTGGGRIEYVAHIHGFPWAICTHPDLPALINASMGANYPAITLRREMFGNVSVTIGVTTIYPADYVQILHGMDPPGEQTVKLSASMGMIDCGAFKVEVLDNDYPLALTHRPENPVFGLDGIHTIPDYRYDGTIRYSNLYEDCIKGDATMSVYPDAELEARILARVAANLPCYMWANQECVAATDANVVGDALVIDIVRGIWHSREQAHYVDDYDGANFPICDVPFGGAVGRPITIWGLLVSDDGTEILDAARARCGRVSTGIESDDGRTTIDCDGWTDWLKTPLKQRSFEAPIRGYNISRPSSLIDPVYNGNTVGHIVLVDVAAPAFEHLWFCNAGASLYFDTYEELIAHIQAELDLLAVGAGVYNANPTSAKIYFDATGKKLCTDAATGSEITGPLPWAFRWGAVPEGDITYVQRDLESDRWNSVTDLWGITNVPDRMRCYEGGGATIPAGYYDQEYKTPPYLYQWPWDMDNVATARNEEITDIAEAHRHGMVKRRRWPVPYNTTAADHAIEINPDYPATRFAADTNVVINVPFDGGIGRCDGNGVNHVIFDATETYSSEDDPLIPAMHLYGGKHVFKGHCLCPVYHPDATTGTLALSGKLMINNAVDPWWIFAELLGNDIGGVYLSERFHADFVPDADWGLLTLGMEPGLPSDQMPTIDWKVIAPFFATITPGEWYKLEMSDKSTILFSEVLEGFLLAHGLAPTWQFDSSWRMWRMSFRPFAITNTTEAHLMARVLDESNIQRSKYKTEHVRENLYNKIDYQGSYNGKEFRTIVHTIGQSAFSSTGGRSTTLSIKDYITQQPSADNIMNDYYALIEIQSIFGSALLPRVAQPAPSITLKTLPSTSLMLGCGCVVVVDDAYIRDPHTNVLGIDDRAALVTESKISLYGKTNTATLRFFSSETRGYAPALQIKNGDETGTDPDTVYFGGAATDPANNVFGFPYWPLTDLAYFDCYRVVGGQAVLDPLCACGPYRVMLVERYTDTPTVYRDLYITDVDIAAGTFSLVGAGFDVAFVPGEYVLLYESWDNANLQPCQFRWLYHADEDKMLIDSGAVETLGKGWT